MGCYFKLGRAKGRGVRDAEGKQEGKMKQEGRNKKEQRGRKERKRKKSGSERRKERRSVNTTWTEQATALPGLGGQVHH